MTESEYWARKSALDDEFHRERMLFLEAQSVRDAELSRVQTHNSKQRHYFACESHSLAMKYLKKLDAGLENRKIAPDVDRSP